MKIFDNGHIYGFFILHLQKTLARYDFEFWAWPVDWRMGENGYVVFKRNLVCLYACHKSLRILVSYCMAIQRKTLTLNMTYCACTGIYSWQVVRLIYVIFSPTLLLQLCNPSYFFFCEKNLERLYTSIMAATCTCTLH